jgi:hypothetical protein
LRTIRPVTDRLIKRWTASYDAEGNAPPLILALNGQKWKILSREESNEGYREAQDDGTLWVSLNLVRGRESIVPEITKLEGNCGIRPSFSWRLLPGSARLRFAVCSGRTLTSMPAQSIFDVV